MRICAQIVRSVREQLLQQTEALQQSLTVPTHSATVSLGNSSSRVLGRLFSSTTTNATGITLHTSAVERLQEVFKGTPDQVLRVKVDPGGCSGFQYVFTIEESPQGDDITLKQDGVQVVVDRVSVEFLRGSTIKYVEDLISSNFQVTGNPNAEQGCGCGASFAVKME